MKNKRRQYDATYRLRKKGIKINTREKTIYTPNPIRSKTVQLLQNDFHFAIQLTII